MAKKKTLKERLRTRRREIDERSNRGGVIYPKEGVLRFRVLPTPDEDTDWAVEALSFYLGKEIGGVFSPETLGNDCPLLEKYHELRDSKKDEDKDLARTFSPRNKYLVAALIYEDGAGKKIDTDKSGKLLQLPSGIYKELLDTYLDPEFNDFLDPDEGFDFKLTRTGKGKNDTSYSIIPVAHKPYKLPKDFQKPVDPMELFKKEVKSYEDLQETLDKFLVAGPPEEEPEEEQKKPRRSSKPRSKKRGNK
jgi:hypothetical protein